MHPSRQPGHRIVVAPAGETGRGGGDLSRGAGVTDASELLDATPRAVVLGRPTESVARVLPTDRRCTWCGGELPPAARSDARTCSQRCRQARHRFASLCPSEARAAAPLRLAYADPPYPGLARRYYEGHPDFAGEVDHAELLSRLQRFDGWALSTSEAALPDVLALCRARELGVRVAAWVRGARPHQSARWPLSSWEAVVYAGGRRLSKADQPENSLVHVARPRTTDPRHVVGEKPARFAYWLFQLLGAAPGDHFVDLFPGTGGIGRAWELYASRVDERRISCDSSSSDT